MIRIPQLLAAILLLFATIACAPVAPWQRGTLAKEQMALESNPIDSVMRKHIYHSREAASEGGAAVGGGCGCY